MDSKMYPEITSKYKAQHYNLKTCYSGGFFKKKIPHTPKNRGLGLKSPARHCCGILSAGWTKLRLIYFWRWMCSCHIPGMCYQKHYCLWVPGLGRSFCPSLVVHRSQQDCYSPLPPPVLAHGAGLQRVGGQRWSAMLCSERVSMEFKSGTFSPVLDSLGEHKREPSFLFQMW